MVLLRSLLATLPLLSISIPHCTAHYIRAMLYKDPHGSVKLADGSVFPPERGLYLAALWDKEGAKVVLVENNSNQPGLKPEDVEWDFGFHSWGKDALADMFKHKGAYYAMKFTGVHYADPGAAADNPPNGIRALGFNHRQWKEDTVLQLVERGEPNLDLLQDRGPKKDLRILFFSDFAGVAEELSNGYAGRLDIVESLTPAPWLKSSLATYACKYPAHSDAWWFLFFEGVHIDEQMHCLRVELYWQFHIPKNLPPHKAEKMREILRDPAEVEAAKKKKEALRRQATVEDLGDEGVRVSWKQSEEEVQEIPKEQYLESNVLLEEEQPRQPKYAHPTRPKEVLDRVALQNLQWVEKLHKVTNEKWRKTRSLKNRAKLREEFLEADKQRQLWLANEYGLTFENIRVAEEENLQRRLRAKFLDERKALFRKAREYFSTGNAYQSNFERSGQEEADRIHAFWLKTKREMENPALADDEEGFREFRSLAVINTFPWEQVNDEKLREVWAELRNEIVQAAQDENAENQGNNMPGEVQTQQVAEGTRDDAQMEESILEIPSAKPQEAPNQPRKNPLGRPLQKKTGKMEAEKKTTREGQQQLASKKPGRINVGDGGFEEFSDQTTKKVKPESAVNAQIEPQHEQACTCTPCAVNRYEGKLRAAGTFPKPPARHVQNLPSCPCEDCVHRYDFLRHPAYFDPANYDPEEWAPNPIDLSYWNPHYSGDQAFRQRELQGDKDAVFNSEWWKSLEPVDLSNLKDTQWEGNGEPMLQFANPTFDKTNQNRN